jgi:hypothetical protein
MTTTKNTVIDSTIITEGEIHIGDNITQVTVEKPVFAEISFEEYDETEFVAPHFTGRIVREISTMRSGKLAVVTGFYGFDKSSFAKHLAFKISEDFIAAKHKAILVKECRITSDYSGIAGAIREEKNDCIFILNNISPKDVNHNLDELRAAAVRASGLQEIIILVSTSLPMKAWPSANSDYWFVVEENGLSFRGKLEPGGIYSRADLLRFLLQSCSRRGMAAEYKDRLKEVLDKIIPAEVKTPEQINLLLDLFFKNKTKDEKEILDMVGKTKKKETLVVQWFNALNDGQKLIALGMTLLDGVYEEQFFAILNRVIRSTWQEYDTGLTALDYADVSPLMHFFNFSGGENPCLESKFPNQRYQTLRAVWETHRRRVASVLPVVVEIVQESAANYFEDWELYANREKRVRLREVLSDVLSDIGRISPQTSEHALLQLAAHDNIGVQMVAAGALAAWRESYEDLASGKMLHREREFFQLLNQWYTDTKFRALVETFLQGRAKADNQNTATTYIRSTIVLALGYASVYDEPNHLSKEIFKLLAKLVHENNRTVVRRLAETLRLLLRSHPRQVGERLFPLDGVSAPLFGEYHDFDKYAPAIGSGLADAQKDFPDDVEEILQDWVAHINKKRPPQAHTSGTLDSREKVIIALCHTLGRLDYAYSKKFGIDRATTVLFELRNKEHHPKIRTLTLEVTLDIYERFFKEMEAGHSNKIPKIDIDKEVKPFAKRFAERYLLERDEQSGGDYWVQIGHYKIDTWVNADERPGTPVEIVLENWINSKNESIVMIAAQSYVEISRLDAEERQALENFLTKQKEEKTKGILPEILSYREKAKIGFLDELTHFFTGNLDTRKRAIKGILNENKDLTEFEKKLLRQRLKIK